MLKARYILLMGFLLWAVQGAAQMTYEMSDTVITECQGILLDSEDGVAGDYDHNENLTFTICPTGGVDSITLSWLSFNVEAPFDFIRIFQGTDTLGPLIAGPITGLALPPTITVQGCITINFISDQNVAGPGWIAQWQVYETVPEPAEMTLVPLPATCSTATMNVTFDRPIHCDSIIGSNFNMISPTGQNITANATGCSNDSTTTAVVNFNPGLNQSGTYILEFTTFYRDACDSLWELTSADTFSITDCPLAVTILANPDTICPGSCTDLTAIATGGDSLNYTYAWSNGAPANPGPHTVCPTTTTTYMVTVTDGSPAPPAIGQVTVVVLPQPMVQPDFNICESEPVQTLTATPVGGTWFGPGIQDSLAGTFLPGAAGPGVQQIIYTSLNGCTDTLIITVDPFDAGPPMAACPGTPPFAMTGFTPAGGTWSGPNITPAGVFNPIAPGTYTVTYTLGACSDTRNINVQNITMPADTNLCSSNDTFTVAFSPFGGVWSIGSQGNNNIFDNANTGTIDPSGGDTANVLVYTINGCSDSFNVDIFQINAGNNIVICPKAGPIFLKDSLGTTLTTPLGGTWSGQGVTNPVTGLFDPTVQNNNYNITVTYTFGSCTATKFVYGRITNVIIDSLTYCRDDSSIISLGYPNTGRNPGGGQWSGPSFIATGQNATFRPADLGAGNYVYTYTRGGCADSINIIIPGPNMLTDTSVCELEPAFQLNVSPEDHPAGGVWSGTGTNPQGIFDPQSAGVGVWPIYYQSFQGCNDTSQVEVFPPPTVTISGLNPNYCYIDSVILLNLSPAGGLLTGTGLVGNGFNPSLAGPGTHQLTYTYGDGACTRTDFVFTTVGLPLNMSLSSSDDTICVGQQVNLNVQAIGGTGSGYNFNWNQGLGNSSNHQFQPTTSGMYIVEVSDGCSDPVSDSVAIVVRQPYSVNFDTSMVQCFGEIGYAVAIPTVPGNYTIRWNTTPPVFGDTLYAPVRNDYSVTVSDSGSGCVVNRSINIPGYPAIRANFSSNPDVCALFDDPSFDFIDVSNGIDFGMWDFGDGTMEAYSQGVNPFHRYNAIGSYVVTLTAENIGQCRDTFSIEVCVDPAELVFYGSFTPNGDGTNDFFEIDYLGAYPNNSLKVFNRYGNLIYQAAPYNNDWNGVSSETGSEVPDGAYFYILDRGDGSTPTNGDVVIMR